MLPRAPVRDLQSSGYQNAAETRCARPLRSALLRPAALAKGVYPLGNIAKLPREPQNKTSDRQNGDLPRHEKQENHPRRLMHEAAPLLSLPSRIYEHLSLMMVGMRDLSSSTSFDPTAKQH